MQLLFGVLGPEERTAPILDRLTRLTVESNPGIDVDLETAPGLRLGRHLRRFARWDDPGGNLNLMLDGEIRSIDGRDTSSRGASEAELTALVALYRQHGSAIWPRLEGSFCLVIRDGSTVRIGFDVAGTRAIYWWAADGILAFHSNLLDLAPAFPGALVVDPAGAANFLANSIYPLDSTAFEAIRLVGAGQFLEVELAGGGVRAKTHDHYSHAPTEERTRLPIDALADELNDLLAPAIARCWRSAERPVVPLSGGVDSRYLAASIVRLAGDPSLVPTITWGEDQSRPGSDGVVAPQVAAALGAPNTWYEKHQVHTIDSFERAIYLTSGEGDGALCYPRNHELHQRLAGEIGYRSLFRGDQSFGEAHRLYSDRALLASSGLGRIRLDPGFGRLLAPDLLSRMAEGQDTLLERWMAGLVAPTPQTRLYEVKYATTLRREIFPYNTLKHANFEVFTPLIERRTLDWVRSLPDLFRSEKRVFKLALARRFPELAAIPFATRNNLPDWDAWPRADPSLARFFREWCEQPGWLHEIGAERTVADALSTLEARAARASSGAPAPPMAVGSERRRQLERRLRGTVRGTLPGKIVREWTMERRAVLDRTMYHRLSRLAVLHGLVGHARARHARRD